MHVYLNMENREVHAEENQLPHDKYEGTTFIYLGEFENWEEFEERMGGELERED